MNLKPVVDMEEAVREPLKTEEVPFNWPVNVPPAKGSLSASEAAMAPVETARAESAIIRFDTSVARSVVRTPVEAAILLTWDWMAAVLWTTSVKFNPLP